MSNDTTDTDEAVVDLPGDAPTLDDIPEDDHAAARHLGLAAGATTNRAAKAHMRAAADLLATDRRSLGASHAFALFTLATFVPVAALLWASPFASVAHVVAVAGTLLASVGAWVLGVAVLYEVAP